MKVEHITIVGVGALGSHVAQFLRSEKLMIRLIDFDRVEQKNMASQFHGKQGLSKNKAVALQAVANFMWGMKWASVPYELKEHNRGELLMGETLVIDCLDNIKARVLVQEYVRDHGLPCLHGALAPNGEYGMAVWDEFFKPDSEDTPGQATCEGGEFLPFIALVSGYLALSAQHFLRTGKKIGFGISTRGVTLI
jgi:hypothetical protein